MSDELAGNQQGPAAFAASANGHAFPRGPTDPPAGGGAFPAEGFFDIQGELPKLPTPANTQSPLRKLGPSPFPKSGFPTLGFLETVYEHIESRAKIRSPGGEENGNGSNEGAGSQRASIV